MTRLAVNFTKKIRSILALKEGYTCCFCQKYGKYVFFLHFYSVLDGNTTLCLRNLETWMAKETLRVRVGGANIAKTMLHQLYVRLC